MIMHIPTEKHRQFRLLPLMILFLFPLCSSPQAAVSGTAEGGPSWEALFDGKTLQNWKITNFGGEGEVSVENGEIILGIGNDLTGVTWTGPLPRMNYEVRLLAKRRAGHDFFCGLTFPVGESPCTLIVGGWGGRVVGLSSIDGRDASENETGLMKNFTDNQWYAIRVRVTEQGIEAWIDQEKVVDLKTANHKLSIRSEVSPSQPFGIATWRTKAALRDIQRRGLSGNQQ
jgi:hypothetical protein